MMAPFRVGGFRPVRDDAQVVYADAGYQGIAKRAGVIGDQHLVGIQWRVAARKGVVKNLPVHDQQIESRKASVRARVGIRS